jgi:hypothetical protein
MYSHLGHHVTQGGQGKCSHVSLSLTVLLTNVANVNDPLLMSDFDFVPVTNFVCDNKIVFLYHPNSKPKLKPQNSNIAAA